MTKRIMLSLLALGLFAGFSQAATMDMKTLGKINLGATPKQVLATPDAQKVYVLTDSAQILVYNNRGEKQGVVAVEPGISGISLLGKDMLLLENAQSQEVSVVSIEAVVNISTAGAPAIGPDDAPVKLVAFEDFECPYCAQSAQILKQAQAAFPDQVQLVFMNFPLSFHKGAKPAALAALAAERQGKFWEMYDILFANYKNLQPSSIRGYAEDIGLDMVQYDQDVADPALEQKISQDVQEGMRVGVRGTPAIYVNGRAPGQRDLNGLRRVIQQELAKVQQ